MFGKWKLERPALICVLLALGVAAAYLPAVFLDFTNYDDPYYVTENPHVRAGISWGTSGWVFTHTCTGNWHPLTLLSHALDCQIYGLSPAGHHLTSVIFHAANTIVLFLLLRSMTGATWRSAAVAALFALHPLRVESVAWISERKDVLSTFFGLLSLWAYTGYARKVKGRGSNGESEVRNYSPNFRSASLYYAMAVGLFALGLMSKPMLVTWPCVMLLLDFWPLNRVGQVPQRGVSILQLRGLIVEKIPFFALAAVSCVVTFVVQREGTAVAPLQDISIRARVLNAMIAYARYIGKSIWPINLAPIYPYVQEWPRWEMLVAPVLLVTVTALAIWKRHQRPYLLAGWAWYLGTLVPVIGLIQVGNQSMADRYTYIPMIGLLVALVWTAADSMANSRWRRPFAITAAAVALVASLIVTQRQLMFWQNTETLFRHTLAVTDKNYIAWNSLGFYFADHHESKEAERYFRKALTISPNNIHALEKLGSILIDQGRFEEAEASARRASELNPRMATAHRTLGLALMKQGKTTEAIEQYQESVGLEPDNATAHYNLANALARLAQFEKARQQYQEAVRLDPTLADAHNNLGYMVVREGKVEQAIAEFKAALQLRPDSWHARYGLADALARRGNLKEAADEFLDVLKAQPQLASAQSQANRIAWILASHPEPQIRDAKRALKLSERLCELTAYTNAIVVETLAVAQAEAGRFAEASSSSERAQTLALETGQSEVAQKAEGLTALFRAGKPYRETPGHGSQ